MSDVPGDRGTPGEVPRPEGSSGDPQTGAGSPRICGRCYEEAAELFTATCTGFGAKPEELAGHPIGMYHCPDCGAMVLAAVPHPELCRRCLDRTHPGFISERFDAIKVNTVVNDD
jgi:hypothetical protein